MDSERRKELMEGVQLAESHGYTVPIHPDELRALLADSEARERCEVLPEMWRRAAKHNPMAAAAALFAASDELDAALGRD